jgi:trypsin
MLIAKKNDMSFAFLSLFFLAGCAPAEFGGVGPEFISRHREPIIGGQQAPQGRYSYAVSLQDRVGHFCGGSLIAKDIVLTAAHCQGGSYDVVINRHNLETRAGQIIPMKREIPHPRYNDRTTNNDFNVVVLRRPTTEDVELVRLNSDSSKPAIGNKVAVAGWGDTRKSDNIQEFSDVLMTVNVNVIKNRECSASEGTIDGYDESYQGQITESMLCAEATGKDACGGDSGGPLVIRGSHSRGRDDVQVGVVSWGIGCAQRSFPGVYARVSSEYAWIRKQVCANSSQPPSWFNCGGGGSDSSPCEDKASQRKCDYWAGLGWCDEYQKVLDRCCETCGNVGDTDGGDTDGGDTDGGDTDGGDTDGGDTDGGDIDGGCGNSDETAIKIDFLTDDAGWETSWDLKRGNRVIASGPPEGRNYARNQRYTGRICVPHNKTYTIVVKDEPFGDGICCKHGKGWFRVSVHGKQKAYFTKFGRLIKKNFFVTSTSNGDSDRDPRQYGPEIGDI